MVAHLHAGMASPVESITNFAQYFQPKFSIAIIQVNIFLTINAGCYVINSTSELNARWPHHLSRTKPVDKGRI
jgi:hypothetical protein